MVRKVLVVDDEPAFCEVLRDFLVPKGYSVVEAYDGNEALKVYDHEKPDVMLLDARMPGKDGLETLREFKAINPEGKVIMVTGVRDEGLQNQMMAEGAFDYITKPFDLNYLLAILTKIGLPSEGE